MTIRMWIVVTTVWVLSLISVASVMHAQAPPTGRRIIRGADIGFMVEKDNGPGDILTGRWMVRIDGQWRHVTGDRNVVPLGR